MTLLDSLLQSFLQKFVVSCGGKGEVYVKDGRAVITDAHWNESLMEDVWSRQNGWPPPFEIVMVQVRKLVLALPVNDWSSGRVDIEVDGLRVLLRRRSDTGAFVEQLRTVKEAHLRSLMIALMRQLVRSPPKTPPKKKGAKGKGGASEDAGLDGFSKLKAAIANRLLANLHPEVKLVSAHIRYEDMSGSATVPCAIGLVVRRFELVRRTSAGAGSDGGCGSRGGVGGGYDDGHGA